MISADVLVTFINLGAGEIFEFELFSFVDADSLDVFKPGLLVV